MTDRTYDITELLAGVQLATNEVHVLRLRKGTFTVVIHPLDLLHFDGREPKYEDAFAQRGTDEHQEASTEPIFKIVLRDNQGYESVQTVDERPTSLNDMLEFSFSDVPPFGRLTLQVAVRGGEETTIFEDVPYAKLHQRLREVEALDS